VLVDRSRERARAGVQDEGSRLIGVDEPAGGDRIGGVSDNGRERVAELRA
jgi:hypothetical protein